ncbi:MAG TPA: antitoxin VbhA family protein [Defluviitaleaceae bacterium]|nr:antitoxin VbhA family protein [Candidatus Epulonipiscium sp.]HOA79677.1 antitoxin VbhA family protein [Defluviitaleaceae bacterium]
MKNSFYVGNPSQLVKEVKGTMAMEGFYLNKQEINMLKRCACGQISSANLVKLLVKKYSQK